jgi:excisionase family DNA binding protein
MQNTTLTIDQVARRLNCSRVHVYRLIAKGSLTAIDISVPGSTRSRRRVTEEELQLYMNKAAMGGRKGDR